MESHICQFHRGKCDADQGSSERSFSVLFLFQKSEISFFFFFSVFVFSVCDMGSDIFVQ
jgi:hypothetical protein